jgi:hypothetical protein
MPDALENWKKDFFSRVEQFEKYWREKNQTRPDIFPINDDIDWDEQFADTIIILPE